MSKKKYKGLCLFCKFSDDCMFPRDPDRPVFHCEEFDDGIIESDAVKNKAVQESAVQKHSMSKESPGPTSRLPGLCSNCELRETCQFPKSEGGVWHCEEYV